METRQKLDCTIVPNEQGGNRLRFSLSKKEQTQYHGNKGINMENASERMVCNYKSKHGFVETIRNIKENGKDRGWYNPMSTNHYEIEGYFGFKGRNKSVTIFMNVPRLTHKLLKENISLAAIIPFGINVYEKENQVYIEWLNIEVVGKMFGKINSSVLKEVSEILLSVNKTSAGEEN